MNFALFAIEFTLLFSLGFATIGFLIWFIWIVADHIKINARN